MNVFFASASIVLGAFLVTEATAQVSNPVARKPAPNGDFPLIAEGKKTASRRGGHSEQALPRVIQSMIDGGLGVRLQDRFVAGGGLTGYVLSSRNGERRIFYVTPDQKHALMGLIFDERLNNLTAEHQRTYMDVTEFLASSSQARAEPPADVLARWAPMSHAMEGAGLEVYIVVDLHSPALRELHRQTRSRLGELKVHWFVAPSPVASGESRTINAGELDEMAKLLGSKSPNQSWSTIVSGQKLAGQPAPANLVDAKTLKDAIVDFLERYPGLTLPAVIYHDAQNIPRVILGRPTAAQWEALSSDGRKVRSARSLKIGFDAIGNPSPSSPSSPSMPSSSSMPKK